MTLFKTHRATLAPKNGTGSSRREFLLGAVNLGVAGALFSLPSHAFSASLLSAADPVKNFITLSQAITEHTHINSDLAARFYEVFATSDRQFTARVNRLVQLLTPGDSAQTLMDKARKAGLNEFLYQIVTAWYTGTVGSDYHGTLVAYKQALMYQPVSDGLVVPTYCGNGPIWWTAPIPDENDGLIASL